jgi:malate dehydrogenase (oxaloacetate-decarboxylating)
VPEIYPAAARKAGAFITATGRGDFDNQLNNSVCFPGILKGTLLANARTITDNMAVTAAYAIAEFAQKRGISPSNIIPAMSETAVFPTTAAKVAMAAVKEGVSDTKLTETEIYNTAKHDIEQTQALYDVMQKQGFIAPPPQNIIDEALKETLEEI